MIDAAVVELTPIVGARAACAAVGRSRASHYRAHPVGPVVQGPAPARPPARPQPRALTAAERAQVLDVLHSPRFVDAAPETVYATLLDEGVYLCSTSTMYRLLRERGETGDRRRHASHPAHLKPELVADAPNRVWSWDITKLRGPVKWTWYYLYVIIDIYSRYVPGWMVASRESAILAERMFAETIAKQHIEPDQLTIHAVAVQVLVDHGWWCALVPGWCQPVLDFRQLRDLVGGVHAACAQAVVTARISSLVA